MSYPGERTTIDYGGTGAMDAAIKKLKTKDPANANDPMEASDGTIVIVNEDGSVTFEAKAPAIKRDRSKDAFDANLADDLDDGALSTIAQDYLDGVESDKLSRSTFISNYNKGIDLLGLKIEEASSNRSGRQSISRSKHPALLKACVRSQSNARGQLLPASGPVKVQTIGDSDAAEDEIAKDLEADFNYYLTDVAREYYPDTDRALFYRAFGGSMFKKVYRCPLRQRPVSEMTSLESLIVSEDATDLHNAPRKTQEAIIPPSLMKRMQLRGGWRDVSLGTPQPNDNQARRKILESQGFAPVTIRPQDQDFTVYEGYWHADPRDYGFDENSAPDGLPLPYKVVIEKDSRQVLALHRNWRKDDTEFFKERQTFVKYGLVPGLGFLDYGFLHLIGNQTRVLTAAWQIMIDKGMLATFPGGMKAKGIKAATNEINPGLGEWVDVDIGGRTDIRQALMGMPYGDLPTNFMQLVSALEEDIERLAGTLEIESGANRQNMPVGTILAMIEQQAQDLTAVHQRDHRSQKEELLLLRDLFVDHPKDLRWLKGRRSKRTWSELINEFQNADMAPASDPNVPSQTHRIMLNMFLLQIAQSAPMLFGSKLRAVAERIITSVGIGDADALLASQEEINQNMANAAQQGKGGKQQSGGNTAGANATIAKAQMDLPFKQADLSLKERKLALEESENQREAANEAAGHQQRAIEQDAERQRAEADAEHARRSLESEHVRGLADTVLGHQADTAKIAHENEQTQLDREHEARMAEADRTHERGQARLAAREAKRKKPKTRKTED